MIFLDNDDDQFEIMFKYYETLRGYQRNLDDLLSKIRTYDEDQKYAEKVVMKPK